jgi:AcrR family transcriptional regulator
MGVKGSANRQRIVEAADSLFYFRGYNQTSFSDISDETGIPRGNFYYYFKTKDDILTAVVEFRVAEFKAMLDKMAKNTPDPRERLLMLASMPEMYEEQLLQYGCPFGTLSSELAKDQGHEISDRKMTEVFDVLRNWSIEQFSALGIEQKARQYSMDLLARLQGIAMLANIYKDRQYLHRATDDLRGWINRLIPSNPNI